MKNTVIGFVLGFCFAYLSFGNPILPGMNTETSSLEEPMAFEEWEQIRLQKPNLHDMEWDVDTSKPPGKKVTHQKIPGDIKLKSKVKSKSLKFAPEGETSSGLLTEDQFNKKMAKAMKDHDPILEDLWEKQLPNGEITSEEVRDDGTTVTFEKTEKGDVISKLLDKHGDVLSSEWRKPSGEFLIRLFHADGSRKGISTGFGKDDNLTFMQNKQGQPKYVQYTLNNGDKVVAKYNDAGLITEKWQVTKDGRYIRFQ